MSEGMKVCAVCAELKPVDAFAVRRGKCRPCAAAYERQRYHKTAPARVERRPVFYRPAVERELDAAFLQWQGGEPRQDWRVRL